MEDNLDRTPTEERVVVTLKVPVALAEMLLDEAKASGSSFASLIRGAVNWHQGRGLARHPDRPPVVLPTNPTGDTTQKSVLLDPDQAEYLDKRGGRVGLARTATLLVILAQYLGDDPLVPTPKRP